MEETTNESQPRISTNIYNNDKLWFYLSLFTCILKDFSASIQYFSYKYFVCAIVFHRSTITGNFLDEYLNYTSICYWRFECCHCLTQLLFEIYCASNI